MQLEILEDKKMQPQIQQLPPNNGMMSALQKTNTGYSNMQPQQQPIPYSTPLQQQHQSFQLTSPPPIVSQSNLTNQNAFNGPPSFSSQPKMISFQQQQDNFSQGSSISSNIRPSNFQHQQQIFQPPQFQSSQSVIPSTSYQQTSINNLTNLEDKISNLTLSGPPIIQNQPVIQAHTQTSNLISPMSLTESRNESPPSFISSINQQGPLQSNQFNQFSINGRAALQRPPGPPSGLVNSQVENISPNGPHMQNSLNQQHQSLQHNQFQQPSNQFQSINQFIPQLPQTNRPNMMPPQPGMYINQNPYINQTGMTQQVQLPPSQFDQYSQQLQQPPSYQQQQQAPNRIDMDSIPNPIEVMQVNNNKYGGEIFETNEAG